MNIILKELPELTRELKKYVNKIMKIIGIETSCDETAVGIVDENKNILSNLVNSQINLHQQYGGVVPEIAARSHVEILDKLILSALKEAELKFTDLDAIAVTAGPGLIGGVIVGLMMAKTIASVYKKPFIAINHLQAHALTARLTNQVEFPYLLLLISGGHCQILLAKAVDNYEKIGETIDDALGEAFDKVAQMLGLNYPGGVEVEKLALIGDENKYKLPKPLILNDFEKKHQCDFSFSGLKTAVRRLIEKLTGAEFNHQISPKKLSMKQKADICASFQRIISEIIINRLQNSLKVIAAKNINLSQIVIAGGVAANRYIFKQITKNFNHLEIITPPIKLCTDNGVMIAWAGIEKFKLNMVDQLNFKPHARWEM
jgi:N6-L-threonylcarbamoyladenine synthase